MTEALKAIVTCICIPFIISVNHKRIIHNRQIWIWIKMTENYNDITTGAVLPDEESSGGFDVNIFAMAFKLTVGLVGLIGNLMVIIILSQLRSQNFKFLIGTQAIIDLLTSLALSIHTFTQIHPDIRYPVLPPRNNFFAHVHCALWYSGVLMFCLFAMSTYNLLAITLERYMAVVHAMWYRTTFSSKYAIYLGVVAWMLAPICQLVYGLPQYDVKDGECVWVTQSPTFLAALGAATFFWDFFIPCVIMGVCFTRICLVIYRQDKESKRMQGHMEAETMSSTVSGSIMDKEKNEDTQQIKKKDSGADMRRSRNVTKTFLIVYFAFVFCWITNQVLFLQFNLGGYVHFGRPENHFANSLSILNSACNPFIYVLHMKQYRDKLKSLLCGNL